LFRTNIQSVYFWKHNGIRRPPFVEVRERHRPRRSIFIVCLLPIRRSSCGSTLRMAFGLLSITMFSCPGHSGDGPACGDYLGVVFVEFFGNENFEGPFVLLEGLLVEVESLVAESYIVERRRDISGHLEVPENRQGVLVADSGARSIPLHVDTRQAQSVPGLGTLVVAVSVVCMGVFQVLKDLLEKWNRFLLLIVFAGGIDR